MRGWAAVGVCVTVMAQGGAGKAPGGPVELWRALGVREPFLWSREALEEPQSLGRFFGMGDYGRLEGNPALGFYAADGFRWVGSSVAWLGVKAVTPDGAAVPEKLWDQAFQRLARRQRWRVDSAAPIRIKGACVGAVVTPTTREPHVGVCLELQVASPTGTLLYRYAVAKPSIEEAVEQALGWTLGCARSMDQIRAGGSGHGLAKP